MILILFVSYIHVTFADQGKGENGGAGTALAVGAAATAASPQHINIFPAASAAASLFENRVTFLLYMIQKSKKGIL